MPALQNFECGTKAECPIQGIATDIMGRDYCEVKLLPMFEEAEALSLAKENTCPANLWHNLGLDENSTTLDLRNAIELRGVSNA